MCAYNFYMEQKSDWLNHKYVTLAYRKLRTFNCEMKRQYF